MFLECVDEVRVVHGGKVHLFEERDLFGYVYEVSDDLGKEALATGKCLEVKGYEGPTETPSSVPVIPVEVP